MPHDVVSRREKQNSDSILEQQQKPSQGIIVKIIHTNFIVDWIHWQLFKHLATMPTRGHAPTQSTKSTLSLSLMRLQLAQIDHEQYDTIRRVPSTQVNALANW